MESFKIYNFGCLQQQHTQRITSTTNIPDNIVFPEKSRSISRNKSTIFLSNIFHDCELLLSQKEMKKNLQIDELKILF